MKPSGYTPGEARVFFQGKDFQIGNGRKMQKQINSDFGFADSEFVSYERANAEFSVQVKAWNGNQLHIVFIAFAGALDYGAGDFSDLIEETDPNVFYHDVVSRVYEDLPADNPYRLYQFLDLDKQPVLEIVACGVNVFR